MTVMISTTIMLMMAELSNDDYASGDYYCHDAFQQNYFNHDDIVLVVMIIIILIILKMMKMTMTMAVKMIMTLMISRM